MGLRKLEYDAPIVDVRRPSPFCFFTSCPRGRVSHQPARAPWAERLRASDARRRLVRGWGRDVGDGRRRTRPRGQSLGEAQTHRRARPPTRRRQGRILRRSRLGFETRRLVPRARRRPPVLRLPTRRARPSRGRPRRAGRDPGVEAGFLEAASRGRSLASRTFVRPRRVRRADRRAVVRAPRAAGRVRRGARGLDSGRAHRFGNARGDCRGMPPGEDGVRRADAGRAGRDEREDGCGRRRCRARQDAGPSAASRRRRRRRRRRRASARELRRKTHEIALESGAARLAHVASRPRRARRASSARRRRRRRERRGSYVVRRASGSSAARIRGVSRGFG